MEPLEFGTLYERYAPDVLRFAVYLTGNRTEAEDITSEAFVRAWAGSGDIRAGTLKAYLFTIARNLHLDRRRRDARRGELPDEVKDPAPDPAAAAESRHELRAVLAELQTLPEIDRAALVLRAVEGFSYEQIGAALEITPAAARVKVHRARVRLGALREERTR
jgi:RNA polymerase sigma-70 factor (ECF subfamily)